MEQLSSFYFGLICSSSIILRTLAIKVERTFTRPQLTHPKTDKEPVMTYGTDDKSALQAKFDAQKIAFAPMMFQAARSLRDLGILDLLNKSRSGLTIEQISEQLNLSVYGVKVLVEAGLSLEMVIVEDGRFKLTKTGWFINNDELTIVNMNFTNDINYLGMASLSDSIKLGKPTGLKEFGEWETVYEGVNQLPEKAKNSWFAFEHYYSDTAFPELMSTVFKHSPGQILDVGGNTGKFSMACAKYDEQVKVTILDLPGQLNEAQKNIANEGFGDRISWHALNLLDHSIPFPKNPDVIWMSQFLDCFSKEDVTQLLRRAKQAMHEDSRLMLLEAYWDNQNHEASTYSLHAISLYFTNIANGCSQMYSTVDMLELIQKAGLTVEETIEHIGVSHTLYVCKKQ